MAAKNIQFDNDYRIRCQIYYRCMANLEPLKADPKLIAQYNTSNILRTTFYSDASYAKLREVSASYVFPGRYAQALDELKALVKEIDAKAKKESNPDLTRQYLAAVERIATFSSFAIT